MVVFGIIVLTLVAALIGAGIGAELSRYYRIKGLFWGKEQFNYFVLDNLDTNEGMRQIRMELASTTFVICVTNALLGAILAVLGVILAVLILT